jgi:hypothetical protein
MKNLLIAAVLLALTATVHAQTPPLNRTQEYRVWSAEQMIDRLVDRFARRSSAPCDLLKQTCQAYPILNRIREIAADGDVVEWAKLIDAVHAFERDNQADLSALKF